MSVFRGRAELLERFRAGDRDALEEVYRAYVGKVSDIVAHGFRIAATGGAVPGLGRQPADLADVVQEIFLKAFSASSRKSFDGARDFGPYVGGIARNVLVDRARRSGRELLMPEVPFEPAQAAAGGDPYADIVARWEEPETVAVAARFVESLPPELARIHRALYVDGLSQREAAAELGITRQAVRTLEGKLREGLRQALRDSEARGPVRAESPARRDSSPGLR
jgi:RNA polymerase sigma-70 factor (ECF subfamily)